jgi:hypothetical protein
MVCTLPQVNFLIAQGKGILFLDEITCARPAMQGAGLAVVYERFIGGSRLPGRIRVVTAANPPEMAAGGWNLAPPMANRLLHINVGVPSVERWQKWLLASESPALIPLDAGEREIQANWNKEWARTCGIASAFVKANRSMGSHQHVLFDLPPEGHVARGRAWTSPRSWEAGLRCLTTGHILQEAEVGQDLFACAVGQGLGVSFAAYMESLDLPDPEQILHNGFEPDKRRMDIAFAAYSSAISFALSEQKVEERERLVVLAWKLLHRPVLTAGMPDVALGAAASLMHAGYATKKGGAIGEAAEPVIYRFGKAGLALYAVRIP